MKFSAALVVAAVPSILASSSPDPLSFGSFADPAFELESRQSNNNLSDLANILIPALYQIGNATVALGKQINAITVLGLTDLQTASLAEVAIINQAAVNVSKATDELGTSDLFPVLSAVTTLTGAVNTTLNALKAHKDDLGGAAFVVATSLQQQLDATNRLNGAVAKKTPQNLLASSAAATKPIVDALTATLKYFNNNPNVNPRSAYTGAASSLSINVGAGLTAAVVVACSMLFL